MNWTTNACEAPLSLYWFIMSSTLFILSLWTLLLYNLQVRCSSLYHWFIITHSFIMQHEYNSINMYVCMNVHLTSSSLQLKLYHQTIICLSAPALWGSRNDCRLRSHQLIFLTFFLSKFFFPTTQPFILLFICKINYKTCKLKFYYNWFLDCVDSRFCFYGSRFHKQILFHSFISVFSYLLDDYIYEAPTFQILTTSLKAPL